MTGSFFRSNRLGQLYVVRGDVVNNNTEACSFIRLRGSLLDVEGNEVRQKLVYAGNTIDEDRLREMSLEGIDRELERKSGKENRNVDIEPSSSVPFMIVFENLPDNLAEFQVEAVDSSPAE